MGKINYDKKFFMVKLIDLVCGSNIPQCSLFIFIFFVKEHQKKNQMTKTTKRENILVFFSGWFWRMTDKDLTIMFANRGTIAGSRRKDKGR